MEEGMLLSYSYAKEQRAMDSTQALLTERHKTHGNFTDHARITQELKAIMQDNDAYALLSAPQREALEMIAHKIGRILAGNPDYRDHWDDIAGYARLVAERCPS